MGCDRFNRPNRGTSATVVSRVSIGLVLIAAACTEQDRDANDGGKGSGITMGATETDSAGDPGTEDGMDGTSAGPRFDIATDGGPTDSGDDGSVMPECGAIPATIRDFKSTHPDFEAFWGVQAFTGLVLDDLGTDKKPVYNPVAVPPPIYDGSYPQITSEDTFLQWYNDVPNTNVHVDIELPLTETTTGSGVFVFDEDYFFPIDGDGFNDETFPDTNLDPHNFHFTTEIHTRFTYEPGQTFTFEGDDDLWTFIDGKLVIDLGGLHGELTGSVDLDTLGLTAGEEYDMDIFHAERRHDGSHFRIETTIDCFTPAPAG